LGDFSKLNTHSRNAVILTSAVVQTSFKHGKSTFFKNGSTKKMWGFKLSFHNREKTLDLNKISALGDFSKLNTHSGNAVIVTSALVQTSFKHGKLTFFKICPTKKIWGIKLSFTSQNPFVL
jgi:cytochrome c biogenesis factor